MRYEFKEGSVADRLIGIMEYHPRLTAPEAAYFLFEKPSTSNYATIRKSFALLVKFGYVQRIEPEQINRAVVYVRTAKPAPMDDSCDMGVPVDENVRNTA